MRGGCCASKCGAGTRAAAFEARLRRGRRALPGAGRHALRRSRRIARLRPADSAELNAGRGVRHLHSIVESLALVHSEVYEADHGRAAHALLTEQHRRSLIVWITDLAETAGTPEVVEYAMQMTRATWCCLQRWPAGPERAGRRYSEIER